MWYGLLRITTWPSCDSNIVQYDACRSYVVNAGVTSDDVTGNEFTYVSAISTAQVTAVHLNCILLCN